MFLWKLQLPDSSWTMDTCAHRYGTSFPDTLALPVKKAGPHEALSLSFSLSSLSPLSRPAFPRVSHILCPSVFPSPIKVDPRGSRCVVPVFVLPCVSVLCPVFKKNTPAFYYFLRRTNWCRDRGLLVPGLPPEARPSGLGRASRSAGDLFPGTEVYNRGPAHSQLIREFIPVGLSPSRPRECLASFL